MNVKMFKQFERRVEHQTTSVDAADEPCCYNDRCFCYFVHPIYISEAKLNNKDLPLLSYQRRRKKNSINFKIYF